MSFFLTDEQQQIQARIRELVRSRVAPHAALVDQSCAYPSESLQALANDGILGLGIPPEYGGGGADWLTLFVAVEEVSRGCSSTGTVLLAFYLGLGPILEAGTQEQKRRYLPRVAAGEAGASFAITERGAGSDASNLSTTATLEGDQYVLNGRKIFCGNGSVSDIYLVTAVTDRSQGPRGISTLIVEKGTPGLSFTPPMEKMGIRGSVHCDVILENVRVPADNLVGAEGQGLKLALSSLEMGRPLFGAWALGVAQAALDAALAYARKRVQFGKAIGEQQAIQFMLADMATEITAARLMLYRVAAMKDAGARRLTAESAAVKLYASQVANRVVYQALQIHGGLGYMRGSAVERLYRDARVAEIAEGTTEINKIVLARALLGA